MKNRKVERKCRKVDLDNGKVDLNVEHLKSKPINFQQTFKKNLRLSKERALAAVAQCNIGKQQDSCKLERKISSKNMFYPKYLKLCRNYINWQTFTAIKGFIEIVEWWPLNNTARIDLDILYAISRSRASVCTYWLWTVEVSICGRSSREAAANRTILLKLLDSI